MTNTITKIARVASLALALSGCGYDPGLPIEQGSKTDIAQSARIEHEKMASSVARETASKNKAEFESERDIWEPKIAKFHKKLEGARKYFNDSLRDGNLSIDEQKEICSQLKDAEMYLDQILYGFAKEPLPFVGSDSRYAVKHANGGRAGGFHFEIRDSRLNFPNKDYYLLGRIWSNLYGFDIGKPELQNDLDKEFSPLGASISVESRFSPLEKGLAGLCALVGFNSLRRKIKREDER